MKVDRNDESEFKQFFVREWSKKEPHLVRMVLTLAYFHAFFQICFHIWLYSSNSLQVFRLL